jgi:oligopeptide/dipeptide ABC transporter ATP-binding protein
MTEPVLEVRGLHSEFPTEHGVVRTARNVNLTVGPGEVLGLVGESGSGKSVLLRTLLGLLPHPGRVTAGEARFGGRDLLAMSEAELRGIRGGEIALIPQDPINNFNPALSIGYQMIRVLKLHRGVEPDERWASEAARMLQRVGIDPTRKLDRYPFSFSQGQLQRVMIAIAVLSSGPSLLFADEPTTSLDVTIEAQVLWLISQLQRERGMAVVYVTHDLGVVAQLADRVAVMYAGTIVEDGPVEEIFRRPRHPYTIAMLRSAGAFSERRERRLFALPGAPPDLTRIREGCAFAPRCSSVTPICEQKTPELRELAGGVKAACHNAEAILEAAS